MQDPNASVTIHLKAAAQTTERLLDTLSPGYRKDLEEWVRLIRQWEATQSWNLSPDFVLKRPTDDNFEGSMGSIRAKISEVSLKVKDIRIQSILQNTKKHLATVRGSLGDSIFTGFGSLARYRAGRFLEFALDGRKRPLKPEL